MGREQRAPCTLTAWRGLDSAISKPALRGKGNSHTSGTHLHTEHPTRGWNREVRCKDDTSVALELLRALTRTVTTARLLSLAPCAHAYHYQPSLLLPLAAPFSHAPFCPSSMQWNKDSRPFIIRHHPAGSKVIEVRHDNPIRPHEVILLAPSVCPTQPTQLALVLLRHLH